jgi:hypothetical protein
MAPIWTPPNFESGFFVFTFFGSVPMPIFQGTIEKVAAAAVSVMNFRRET